MVPNTEQTFIMVKPDGVQRGLINKVIKKFEQRGYKLVAMKMTQPTVPHVEQHYSDLSHLPFFNSLVQFMASGPVVAMVWEGFDVVSQGRVMLGETKPNMSAPGTLRGQYCIDIGRNMVHGSDSVNTAQKEIAHWFQPDEIFQWTPNNFSSVYE